MVSRQRYFPRIIWKHGKVANPGQLVCRVGFDSAHGKDVFAEGTTFAVRFMAILPCKVLCRAPWTFCAVLRFFAVGTGFTARKSILCRVPGNHKRTAKIVHTGNTDFPVVCSQQQKIV